MAAFCRARLWIVQGNIEAAMRWVEERGLGRDVGAAELKESDDLISYRMRKYEHLLLSRVLIAQDRPADALALLEPLLTRMEPQGRIDLMIEIQALKALALQAQGNVPQALTALERTGRGRYVDVSQMEVTTHVLMGATLLAQAAGLHSTCHNGNRHWRYAPHGCYPCLGVDQWVTIAVRDRLEWEALASAMGRDEWKEDDRFLSAEGRRTHQDLLDQEGSQLGRVLHVVAEVGKGVEGPVRLVGLDTIERLELCQHHIAVVFQSETQTLDTALNTVDGCHRGVLADSRRPGSLVALNVGHYFDQLLVGHRPTDPEASHRILLGHTVDHHEP